MSPDPVRVSDALAAVAEAEIPFSAVTSRVVAVNIPSVWVKRPSTAEIEIVVFAPAADNAELSSSMCPPYVPAFKEIVALSAVTISCALLSAEMSPSLLIPCPANTEIESSAIMADDKLRSAPTDTLNIEVFSRLSETFSAAPVPITPNMEASAPASTTIVAPLSKDERASNISPVEVTDNWSPAVNWDCSVLPSAETTPTTFMTSPLKTVKSASASTTPLRLTSPPALIMILLPTIDLPEKDAPIPVTGASTISE